jgi:Protein of unknown function (DUF2726)
MEFLPPQAAWALPTTVLLLLTLLWMRVRGRARQKQLERDSRDHLDTVAAWPPQAVRVLTISERQAYDLLRRALPGFLVLAQVPLSRFLRVPTRNSYTDWIQRVGLISADLLLCDSGSRVLAVIDVRAVGETPRAGRRHQRMVRVLQAAGIRVITWQEGHLPSLAEARAALAPLVGVQDLARFDSGSRPMSLDPSASLTGLLEAGDRAAMQAADDANEPVPSAFFEDCEVVVPNQR